MRNREQIKFNLFGLMAFALTLTFATGCQKDDEYEQNNTNGRTLAIFNPDLTYGNLTDQDDNVYKTIQIGTQTWMAENLRTTKYRNGDEIPKIVDDDIWRNINNGAYCNIENTNDLETIATFGRIYNWNAVSDIREIAPKGWRIPTDAEWDTLITYLGYGDRITGDSIAGAFLKEAGDTHWLWNNVSGTPIADNSSGFTALPCGWKAGVGFGESWYGVNYWTSTDSLDIYVSYRYLANGSSFVYKNNSPAKQLGFSVRCIKD